MERTTQDRTTAEPRRRWIGTRASVLALALLVAAPLCGQDLVPVPEPSLEDAEPGLRQRIESARDALDSSAAAYGELGSLYLLSELRAPAAAAFANARRLDPSELRWHYFYGLVKLDLGDLPEAVEALRAARALRPESPTLRLRLAEALRQSGELEESRTLFEGVLRDASGGGSPDPGQQTYAHFGLGRIAVAERRFADAVEHLEAVRRAAPEADVVGRVLGLAYREVGRMDEARAAMAAGGDRPVALPDPWVAQLQTMDVGAYLADAVKARLDEDYDEAARLYRRAVEADPARRDPKTADALRGLGEILFVQGDAAGSVAALEEAVAAWPERAELHAKLGEVLTLVRRPADAVAPYRRAAELAPNDPGVHLGLGRALAMTGRHEEALGHYERSLGLDPDHVETRALRARALRRLGRDAEAADELGRALALDPGNVRLRMAHVDALAQAGRTVAVRESLEAGVRSNDDPRLVQMLVQVLLGDPDPARRDPERAVRLATELLQEDPSVSNAVVLARALFGAGRVAEAVRLQERLLAEARSAGAPESELAPLAQTLAFYESRLAEGDGGGAP